MFVEDPYYEYTIDETLCIGCGKCVKGCSAFGNGSLYLQVGTTAARTATSARSRWPVPSQAFVRVPAADPYLLKDRKPTA